MSANLQTLTNEEFIQAIQPIPDDTTITIKYLHVRDMSSLRVLRGTMSKTSAGCNISVLMPGNLLHRHDFPNDATLIVSVSHEGPTPHSTDPLLNDTFIERQPPQPAGERTAPLNVQTSAMFDVIMSQLNQLNQRVNQQAILHPPPAPHQPAQDDIGRLHMLSDAIKGQDTPTWRLQPGLILPRFIPEKFEIFSIPHLLFRDDPVTGTMVRVPMGTALIRYQTIQPMVKMKFPNQFVAGRPTHPKESKTNHHNEQSNAGVLAQLERAERTFLILLTKIDGAPSNELPSSKSEWILFLDAGVEVLEHYATLAFGFAKGGGRISTSYAAALGLGKFDPNKLWETAAVGTGHFRPS